MFCIAISCSAYALFQFDKVSLHLKINTFVGNSFIDTFFKYFTHIGDGLFTLFIAIIFLVFNIRNGIYILITYSISGLITFFLKNYFYDNVNRPHFVFGYFVKHAKVNYIEGVDMVGLNSFPSGHATSAFALFTCLALLTKNRYLKILFFVMALLAAFSRTYLSQHWLVDVTIGSLIGTLSALFFYYFIIVSDPLKKLNKPLFNFKKIDPIV